MPRCQSVTFGEDNPRGVPHGRGASGYRLDDHSIGTDPRTIAHCKTAQNLRASTHDHPDAKRRVAFLTFVKSRATKGDALIDGAVITNDRCLADHHPMAVVDEHAPADLGAWVNLDPREHPAQMRHKAR